jgi:hypothetical protein
MNSAASASVTMPTLVPKSQKNMLNNVLDVGRSVIHTFADQNAYLHCHEYCYDYTWSVDMIVACPSPSPPATTSGGLFTSCQMIDVINRDVLSQCSYSIIHNYITIPSGKDVPRQEYARDDLL